MRQNYPGGGSVQRLTPVSAPWVALPAKIWAHKNAKFRNVNMFVVFRSCLGLANLGLFQYPLKFLLLFAIQQESQSKPRRNWFPNDNKVYPAPGRKAVQVWDFFLKLIFLLQYFQSGWVHVCAVLNCKHCSMYLSTLCLKQRQCNCNALVLIGCTH